MKCLKIWCCECNKEVVTENVGGDIIYPHRPDLKHLRFERCLTCKNFVGTHKNDGRPLGTIPTQQIKILRIAIHNIIDPIWKGGTISRRALYREMRIGMGIKEYHTAELNTIEDCKKALKIAKSLRDYFFEKY